MSKVICIGIPVFNGAAYLRKALDSLLVQTYQDFRIIIVDDGSTDDSYTILEAYAKQDSRITLFKNPTRMGLITTWNLVAELCSELFDPDYFAWFADHDWVEQNWLEELIQVLESNSSTVLAHPKTNIVDAKTNAVIGEGVPLDTASLQFVDALRAVTIDFFGAGDAVYGLFRYEVLRQIGFFPREILPDRLVVSEACLFGDIRHVPATCRYRLKLSLANDADEIIDRQLATLFSLESERPDFPTLRHGIYFLRRFIEIPDHSPPLEVHARRLIHACLYLIRQYNKHSTLWEKEYSQIQGCKELSPYFDLVSFIIEGKWIPLTRDADVKLKELSLCNKLRQRLSEETSLRKTTQSRVGAFKGRCNMLSRRLAEAEENLLEEVKLRKVARSRAGAFKSNSKILRQHLSEAEEKLSCQIARCKKAESSAISYKSRCTKLRQEIVDIEEKLLGQTARLEESESCVRDSETLCKELNQGLSESEEKLSCQIALCKKAESSAISYKSRCTKLRQKIVETEGKVLSQTAQLEETELCVRESKARCEELRQSLVEVEGKLSCQTAQCKKAELRVRQLECACNELKHNIVGTKKMLEEQNARRKEAKIRALKFKAYSSDLRRDLLKTKKRFSEQVALYEENKSHLAELKSSYAYLQTQIENDASLLASLQETNAQLLAEIEFLADRISHPFHLLLQTWKGRLQKAFVK